ncbi:MAG: hypothetical protein RL701_6347, partial [Pseudomonadota bacterium]
ASAARAHAPLLRALALAPDGSGQALALPGFGLLLQTRPDQPYAYACDALLNATPRDTPPLLAYAHQNLIVGSLDGLRVLAADGCPFVRANDVLQTAPVLGLAVHAQTQTAYLVAAGRAEGIWRSDDAGQTWRTTGPLPNAAGVTALRVDPGAVDQLYISQRQADGQVQLLVSRDGGASFETVPQARAITLLHVESGASSLWAVARAADSVGNRGFELLRAEGPAQPWRALLRVNYFGGLSFAPDGAIWVGDEGGGVYRSLDHGESFENLDNRNPAACIVATDTATWTCASTLPDMPSLRVRPAAGSAFEPSLAFKDVTQLVSCPAALDVERTCQAAWIEWQRDILIRDMAAYDAGVPPPSAAEPAAAEPAAAGVTDAGAEHGAPAASACSVNHVGHAREHGLSVCCAIACVMISRRGRARRLAKLCDRA